jgi:hypothetical protein
MNEGHARSARITRRTFGVLGLVLAGLAGVRFWPQDALSALAARPDAPALKALGRLPAVQALGDIEARLKAKLSAAGYDTARTSDALSGAMIVIDGWQIPETTGLAAAWLAQKSI